MNISDRLRAVIESVIPDRRRSIQLEYRTAIPSETWRKFLKGQQNATIQMIEAVSREWPEYAFWIATGITDTAHGHIGPDLAYQNPVNWNRLFSRAAAIYFKTKLHQLHGEETLDSVESFLPKPNEGSAELLKDGDQFQFAKEEAEYRNADDLQKLRMEADHFRFNDEKFKFMASKLLRYGE